MVEIYYPHLWLAIACIYYYQGTKMGSGFSHFTLHGFQKKKKKAASVTTFYTFY